ncbi:MAG: glycerol-3-phosphate dehydrogenase/oxidase, partial [Flavisolibacter sp.]
FIVIGGGASGLGVALDASVRGYSVLLLEQSDFAKGTSSRSTKLIHGGVRYLASGNIRLVYEALRERGILWKNAPHLVKEQAFIIPCYSFLDKSKYWAGLKLYDWMAGRLGFGKSSLLTREQVNEALPNIENDGLVGGIQYFDAQFDDARLAVNLAQTAAAFGAVPLNYCRINGLLKKDGKVCGVVATDVLSDKQYNLHAKIVINATGVFADKVLALDRPQQEPRIRPSQGVHLVIDRFFLESDRAILIPKTSDNRVLFVIPWHNHVLVGTTDTPVTIALMEPIALEQEIDFILKTVTQYLSKAPGRKDVLSVFAGLRPLAASNKKSTKEISRSHKIIISASNLVTVIGGKWTTYRKMAEDVVDKAIELTGLTKVKCQTKETRIHGYTQNGDSLHSVFGADEELVNELLEQSPSLRKLLDDRFPFKEAHVVWAVRNEMAVTIEDVLARRLRLLFLDARAAMNVAPRVAVLMAKELNHDEKWIETQIKEFMKLANAYLVKSP